MKRTPTNNAKTKQMAEQRYQEAISRGFYSYDSYAYQLEPLETDFPQEKKTRFNQPNPQIISNPTRTTKKQQPPKKQPYGTKHRSHVAQKKTQHKKKHAKHTALHVDIDHFLSKSNLFLLSFVFSLVVVYVALTAISSYRTVLLNQSKKEYARIHEEVLAIGLENIASYDLKKIEQIASYELNMGKPEAYQLVHITAPKSSYIVQHEDTAEKDTYELIVSGLAGFWNEFTASTKNTQSQ